MIDLAIKKINPNAEFTINADDIDQITWLSGTNPIAKAEIEAQLPIVEFEFALANLRAERNKDLQESDWTVLQDNPLTPAKRSEWMVYRTELRNITQGLNTVEDINNINYPDKPNG